jgi:serine/threonine protein kinase
MQVMIGIAERVRELHAAGYVHRDIKSSNVMWLPGRNRWTVIDFGCAARTGSVATIGYSLAYAAPEAVQAREAGERAMVAYEALDAWSLGVLALELFSGKPTFSPTLTHGQVRPRNT